MSRPYCAYSRTACCWRVKTMVSFSTTTAATPGTGPNHQRPAVRRMDTEHAACRQKRRLVHHTVRVLPLQWRNTHPLSLCTERLYYRQPRAKCAVTSRCCQDGRLLVGASDHAMAFSAFRLEVKPPPPDVTILDFRVLNHPVIADSAMNPKTPLKLNHDQNYIGIEFKIPAIPC